MECIQSNRKIKIKVERNVSRKIYLGLMNVASVIIGNSSSGILEAPSFKLPAVNIGRRQQGRYQGSYKKCKKCGLKLSTDNAQECNKCGEKVQYSEFIHVYDNYGFFAVLKCTSISKKSKLNMEPFEGQEFPPIIN